MPFPRAGRYSNAAYTVDGLANRTPAQNINVKASRMFLFIIWNAAQETSDLKNPHAIFSKEYSPSQDTSFVDSMCTDKCMCAC